MIKPLSMEIEVCKKERERLGADYEVKKVNLGKSTVEDITNVLGISNLADVVLIPNHYSLREIINKVSERMKSYEAMSVDSTYGEMLYVETREEVLTMESIFDLLMEGCPVKVRFVEYL